MSKISLRVANTCVSMLSWLGITGINTLPTPLRGLVSDSGYLFLPANRGTFTPLVSLI